jgi:hypothetical protein
VKDNKRATRELARLCGLPLEKLESDLRRDFYLTAAEASQYGVVDQVMLPAQVGSFFPLYLRTLCIRMGSDYCVLTCIPLCTADKDDAVPGRGRRRGGLRALQRGAQG